jgi:hypothetical protein
LPVAICSGFLLRNKHLTILAVQGLFGSLTKPNTLKRNCDWRLKWPYEGRLKTPSGTICSPPKIRKCYAPGTYFAKLYLPKLIFSNENGIGLFFQYFCKNTRQGTVPEADIYCI